MVRVFLVTTPLALASKIEILLLRIVVVFLFHPPKYPLYIYYPCFTAPLKNEKKSRFEQENVFF